MTEDKNMNEEQRKLIEQRVTQVIRKKNLRDYYSAGYSEEYCVKDDKGKVVKDEKWGKPIIDWKRWAKNNGAKEGTRRIIPGISKGMKFGRFGGENGVYITFKEDGEKISYGKLSLPYYESQVGHMNNYVITNPITTEELNKMYNDSRLKTQIKVLESLNTTVDTRIGNYVKIDIEKAKKIFNDINKEENWLDEQINKRRNELEGNVPKLTDEEVEEQLEMYAVEVVLDELFAEVPVRENGEEVKDEKGNIIYKNKYDQELREYMLKEIEPKVDFKIYISEIAPAFGQPGGGIQIELPLSLDFLKESGFIQDDERVSEDIIEEIWNEYQKENLAEEITLDEFLDDERLLGHVEKIFEKRDKEEKNGDDKSDIHVKKQEKTRGSDEIYDAVLSDNMGYNMSSVQKIVDIITKELEKQTIKNFDKEDNIFEKYGEI